MKTVSRIFTAGFVTATWLMVVPASGQSTWTEGWERASVKKYIPQDSSAVYISGDKGQWSLGDTSSSFGNSASWAEVIVVGGNRSLKLVTREDEDGDDNNMWVGLTRNPNLPVTPGTMISFQVACRIEDPQWGGWKPFPTLFPPPGDNVHLMLWDNHGNRLVYLFQRPPDYVPHTTTIGPNGYHEVFIDTYNAPGGTYQRNLYEDFKAVPGFSSSGGSVTMIKFEITTVGEVTLGDLSIGTPDDPGDSSKLTLQVSGQGTVTPNLNGQILQAGKTYTLTAKPAAGHVFAGWTGSLEADTPTLSFEMKKGMALQANFVPSPFTPVKGAYAGLVVEGSGVAVARSGFFSLTVTDMGAYSGRLQLGAARYAISGQFNPSGQASVSTPAGKAPSVTVQLQLDLASGSDRITGSVIGGGWSAGLEGDRAVFDGTANLAPAAGNYTLVLPGDGSCTGRPGGDGYGTVMVDGAGKLRFAGVLADGSKVSQSATLSKNGEWPLFVSLDRGGGMLLGWVALGSSAAEEMEGEGVWVKPGSAGAKYYPNGFAMNVAVTGSRYVAPVSGSNPLGLSAVEARLQCGGLGAPVVLGLTLDGSGKVTNLSSKEASLGFNAKTGVFKGRSTVAGQAKPISFSGVVLQSQQTARGFFLGTEASGSVWMGPAL